ncbi:hypothetical protein D9M69_695150 [compost metagenome]
MAVLVRAGDHAVLGQLQDQFGDFLALDAGRGADGLGADLAAIEDKAIGQVVGT